MSSFEREKISSNVDILTIKEVGQLIKRKDFESIKKWLKENNVAIYRYGKIIALHKVDVERALILRRIKNFKRKFPLHWANYFIEIIKDKALFDLIRLRLKNEIDFKSIPKIKIKSNSDNKLYQKFS